MRGRRRLALLLLAGLLLGLGAGCSLMQQPQTYMRLPKLMVEEAKLMEQVQLSLPAGAAFIRPRRADQRNTVAMLDLDGDSRQEAVLFYKNKGDKDQIIGEIWTSRQGVWQRLATIPGEGNELDTLKFADLMMNGRQSVMIGYSAANKSDQRGLTVYSLEADGQLTKQFESPYQEFVVDDLNADGKKDVTVINRAREKDKDKANAVLYQYEQSMQKLGMVDLDPSVNGYYNVIAGAVAPSQRGILLDAGVGAHSSTTQLLLWENGRLRAVFSDRSNPTFRAYTALSTDVDGDGILDIPLMKEAPGWEEAAMAYKAWLYPYYKWDGKNGLTFVLERYYNNEQGYYVDIPKDWVNRYTVEKTPQSVRFVGLTGGQLLAEIRAVPVDQWTESAGGWIELTRTGSTVFEVNTEAAPVGRSAFHLITETTQQKEDRLP